MIIDAEWEKIPQEIVKLAGSLEISRNMQCKWQYT